MRSIIVLLVCIVMASASCKKMKMDKECTTPCGSQQYCNDGECACDSTKILLGGYCIDKCESCYAGSFDCGCTDKYIFTIDSLGNEVKIQYIIPGTNSYANGYTEIKNLSPTKFRFIIPRYCEIGDKKSSYIEFTVDKSDPKNLLVEARHHNLPSNETVATCSAIFSK